MKEKYKLVGLDAQPFMDQTVGMGSLIVLRLERELVRQIDHASPEQRVMEAIDRSGATDDEKRVAKNMTKAFVIPLQTAIQEEQRPLRISCIVTVTEEEYIALG